ncbi:hypothetical protein ACN2C7_11055 [Caulobacter sp. ErkDOM-E]|uniref:hypothetical protein n=1 Tax=Caulobacter sp. ErkDOM-E TaxID=3402778 RepID=UPI003AF429EF
MTQKSCDQCEFVTVDAARGRSKCTWAEAKAHKSAREGERDAIAAAFERNGAGCLGFARRLGPPR